MIDRQYLDLVESILVDGVDSKARNGLTRKIFHKTLTINSTPLISIRRTAWQHCLREFEWFLSGSSDIKDLDPSVRHWWKFWANSKGKVKNNYSKQFRKFEGTYSSIDQIRYLQKLLKKDNQSRRMVITTWNTADMAHPSTPITNCHGSLIVANVNPETNKLSLSVTQRSADVMVGLPHNLLQYWAFLLFLADHANLSVGTMYYTVEDAHIYEAHLNMAHRFTHTPISDVQTPRLIYSPSSDQFLASDFSTEGDYKPIIKESLPLIV